MQELNSLTKDQTQGPAVRAHSPNHWTARKFSMWLLRAASKQLGLSSHHHTPEGVGRRLLHWLRSVGRSLAGRPQPSHLRPCSPPFLCQDPAVTQTQSRPERPWNSSSGLTGAGPSSVAKLSAALCLSRPCSSVPSQQLFCCPETFQAYILPSATLVFVQSSSRVQLFETPWTVAHQASLFLTISWSLPKFMSVESVTPSNHLIFCYPLLLPSVFPSIRVFSNESAVLIRWPKY